MTLKTYNARRFDSWRNRKMKRVWQANFIALIVCSSLLGAPVSRLSAQIATGRITGRVTDSTGAVIAGANVTITNDATSVAQTLRSSATGTYVFEAVNPGSYTLMVDAPGFRRFISQGIPAHTQESRTIDVPLAVGAVGQEVSVAAAAQLLQEEDASVGQTITEEQINN